MQPCAISLHARSALLPDGWACDVRLRIGADGRIAEVSTNVPGSPTHDLLLAAPANVHSHAFQRAMAGLTEARGPEPRDTFWTWRQAMFRFLDLLTPDDVEAIAALVQMEMLETGYGSSVEFHYLHHGQDGMPYADPAEMAGRILAAARTSGAGLTLLPVHYRYGGLDRRALLPGQSRFGTDLDGFADLWQASLRTAKANPADTIVGVAPHSLRAIDPSDLGALAALAGQAPIHMHLAEQVGEVAEVKAALGCRPVEWMLEHAELGPRWCLIHCTQMIATESRGLARSGVVAGLCPITEASLGDGIFDGPRYLAAGGAIAIGSDSNIRISLTEELRQLEYSQRLRDKARAVLATREKSSGRRLFDAVCAGGAQAAGRASGALAVGNWADLLALKTDHPDLAGRSGDTILDSWIFGSADGLVDAVWSAGRPVVKAGRHVARDAIRARYAATMMRLGALL